MTKLSRKDKYRDLRSSIEQEAVQTSAKPERSIRMAAPDMRQDQRNQSRADSVPVLEDLLGEVKQYNLDNGDLNLEDTQMQILHNLNSAQNAKARRSQHLVAMEQNEDAGGTTRNLYGSDLSSVVSVSSMPSQSARANRQQSLPRDEDNPRVLKADEIVEEDYLDLFTPNGRQEEVVSVSGAQSEDGFEALQSANRKIRKKEKKKSAGKPRQVSARSKEFDDLFETASLPVSPDASARGKSSRLDAIEDTKEQDYFAVKQNRRASKSKARQDDEDKPAGKAAMIFMVICCIVLVILIALTIFWMSKLGIF
ncbi:hypothetical protein IM774_10405 [Erysipelotrichaceae bacterium RD49]|nr:hypothetical protein [Erysipelotrichaceae bacterium RD49]